MSAFSVWTPALAAAFDVPVGNRRLCAQSYRVQFVNGEQLLNQGDSEWNVRFGSKAVISLRPVSAINVHGEGRAPPSRASPSAGRLDCRSLLARSGREK